MHVNSKYYQSKPTLEVFKEQEEEKKRKYQQRVLDVEMGSFTPDKIAQKDTEPYHIVITWLRSVHVCIKGSWTPFCSKIVQSLDCKINVASVDIRNTWSICFYT